MSENQTHFVHPEVFVVRSVINLKGATTSPSSVAATLTSIPAEQDTEAVRAAKNRLQQSPVPDLIIEFHTLGENAEIVAVAPDGGTWQTHYHGVEAVVSEEGMTTRDFAKGVNDYIVRFLSERPL